MALTKADLSEYVSVNRGLSKKDARELVEVFFDVIAESLEKAERVKLSGFGNFNLRDKPPRPGRNPKTGKPAEISARRVVTFSMGQKFRSRLELHAAELCEKFKKSKNA